MKYFKTLFLLLSILFLSCDKWIEELVPEHSFIYIDGTVYNNTTDKPQSSGVLVLEGYLLHLQKEDELVSTVTYKLNQSGMFNFNETFYNDDVTYFLLHIEDGYGNTIYSVIEKTPFEKLSKGRYYRDMIIKVTP